MNSHALIQFSLESFENHLSTEFKRSIPKDVRGVIGSYLHYPYKNLSCPVSRQYMTDPVVIPSYPVACHGHISRKV